MFRAPLANQGDSMRHFPVLAIALMATASLPAQAQDAAAGQRVFNQCRACHVIENNGRNGVGPNLHGIVGRRAASIESFRYSANMRTLAQGGLTWDEASLRRYITNPKDLVPQGSMAFAGIRNEQQINDLIAYLKTQGG
jgi:cytochrome c